MVSTLERIVGIVICGLVAMVIIATILASAGVLR